MPVCLLRGAALMAFIDHIHACNSAKPQDYIPFCMDGRVIGGTRPAFANALIDHPSKHVVRKGADGSLHLARVVATPDARSQAFAALIADLHRDGIIKSLHGEKFDVRPTLNDAPLCVMDRSAMSYFGFRSWGVHLNGYVRKNGGIYMWIAHRSKSKPTYPGQLDNMVAGGQPTGYSFRQNMVKECAEEANIPESLTTTMKAVGTVSYVHETEKGIKPDVMVNYDLELPADFVPRPVDGEVSHFELLPLADVAERVRTGFDFKFNCALVIIDFLIRHGAITPDNEPDYAELTMGLHRDIAR
jgi:8-oxo-dGTP pyrophosphatase MutT (NUDIX family)|tara:strand:- start:172783 stop:173685 length:903 start_codon:yes stop_codon:yes gene_type:complete